ncbi:MAG: CotH kinase family protein [Bacteroidales bacterium]|jgi:hypothetical protein|nr:CotH kinase family protein [Bacteroidales bacterium]
MMKENLTIGIILFLSLCTPGRPLAKDLPKQMTNLPTIYINTDGGAAITSKTTYVSAKLLIVSSDPSEQLLGTDSDGVKTEIRGRGNSTWNMAKKPYRIKLDKKTRLLNMPASAKSWTLLANYADKSLIRNTVAFKISQLVGLEYTPQHRFVDVVLNGQYIGNYILTDQVEVREHRVPVEEQDVLQGMSSLPDISGGYLIEIDGFASGEPVWFTTGKNLKVTVKYPDSDEIVQQQIDYIQAFTQRFEDALFSQNFTDPDAGYRAFADSASLVNWYICCELTGNSDSFWSTFIYKRRGIDKFFFGPLWDYDIAFNNDSRLGDATRKLMRESAHNPKTWIKRLWEDEWFRQAVYRRWHKLVKDEQIQEKLSTCIDDASYLIDASQQKNYTKWGKLNQKVYLEQFLFPTYRQYVSHLETYIKQRINFLNESFFIDNIDNPQEPPQPEPSRPFAADDYYYIIQNVKTNSLIDVQSQSTVENAMLTMWSPIPDEPSQEWIIKPTDETDVFRLINRNSKMAIASEGTTGKNLLQAIPDATDRRQQWRIVPVLTGDIYGLQNVASSYVSYVLGGSSANGVPVLEWNNYMTTQEEQQWYIQKTDELDDADKDNSFTTIPSRSATDDSDPVVESRCYTLMGVLLQTSERPDIYIIKNIHRSGKIITNYELRITRINPDS